ncbi:MAG TPA: methyl-accepting chemotaxis protein [Rhodocyclaceae bacterium]
MMVTPIRMLKISTKLWMLVILFFVAMLGNNLQDLSARKAQLLAEKQLKTRHLVETAFSVLKQYQEAEKSGALTTEQAQAGAIKVIKGLRYEEKEYFWINDLGKPVPKMIMHPTVPALDGKVLDDAKFNRATSQIAGANGVPEPLQGKNLFVAFVDVAERAGQGYVLYDWPKPVAGGGTTSELFTKLSYVKKFEPWGWLVGSGIYIDDVDAVFWQTVRAQLFVDLLLVLALGLVSWVIGRGIIGPIDQTAEALDSISAGEGDLTMRLKVASGGSIAQLAAGFNSFVARIEKTIGQVSACTGRLGRACEDVSGVARHTSKGVLHQQDETRAVVAAVSDMSGRAQAVAESAAGALDAARQADAAACAGKNVVDGTVASIGTLATNVEQANGVIGELSKESANIGSILDEIREIADQTNLLALNAAIEAARAGEQGRGFAVVADEVRVLAQRTQDSTQQIQRKIETFQKGTQAAADAMATSLHQAHASVGQAASAGDSLAKITRAVSIITEINAKIAAAAQEQSGLADGIKRRLHEISEVAEQTAQDSNSTQTATVDLTALVAELQGLVHQFKIST